VQQRKDTPDGCLDDETLAAYVDGGLTADERSRVESHLAACQDCFAVFSETVKTVQAMRAEDGDVVDVPTGAVSEVSATEVGTPAVVVPMPPRRSALARRLVMVGGLAAAAMLAVALWWPRPERPELVELVAAVGERRPVEGRLTGGFKFGPIESPTRGAETSSDWRVLAAAGKLEEEARGTENARLLGAAGTAGVVTGQFDAAVARLDQAIELAADDPLLLADRAAALIARGDSQRSADDYERALNDALAALTARPAMPEALFNKALALRRLQRSDEELAAWRSYMATDDSSAWAAEAARRVQEIQMSPAGADSSRRDDAAVLFEPVESALVTTNRYPFQPFIHKGKELAPEESKRRFPASVRTPNSLQSNETTPCSATLIGPRALLTAAHCVKHGQAIKLTVTALAGKCSRPNGEAPYGTADYALCSLPKDLPDQSRPFETLLLNDRLQEGSEVLMTGFGGVTSAFKPKCGGRPCFTIGHGTVESLPSNDNLIQIVGEPRVWFGDSGGATFLIDPAEPERRVQVGVNHATTSPREIRVSTLAGVNTPAFKKFLEGWQSTTGNRVCRSDAALLPECRAVPK